MNSATIIGNLGADPRFIGEGDKRFASLRVATTDRWKDKNTGELKERTEWHDVTVFAPGSVKFCAYLRKGGKVAVRGKIETRKVGEGDDARYYTGIVVRGPGDVLENLTPKSSETPA